MQTAVCQYVNSCFPRLLLFFVVKEAADSNDRIVVTSPPSLPPWARSYSDISAAGDIAACGGSEYSDDKLPNQPSLCLKSGLLFSGTEVRMAQS